MWDLLYKIMERLFKQNNAGYSYAMQNSGETNETYREVNAVGEVISGWYP